ncbi:metal-dependent hydrolase family protein [Halomonas denitrificans]|nr:amidohydrolase family protein [Halomonas denitrificans]
MRSTRCSLMMLAATGLMAALSTDALRAETWLRCGATLDVEAGALTDARTLVVVDGRIERIERGHPDAPGDEEIVDLARLTCLPGLMDMHTHLTSESSPSRYADRFTDDAADVALQSVEYARETLAAGFTTVRDLGDSYNASIALRDAIERGVVPGPRIYTSGKSLATTGGHADPTNGWRADLMGAPTPRDGVLNGPAEAREAVRQRYKDGADLIKVTITGGVLSVARSGMNPQFRPDEIEAVIETAADYDMHVAAHAHGAEGMKRAIRAGIHSIEHGTYMDDEVIELMIENGTWFVPTISAGKFVAEKAEIDGYYPEVVRPKAATIGPLMQDTFGRAHAAGVRIAFGTDCGVCYHGDNALEFGFMVEAGMSPADALRSATLNAAELLGVEDRAGRLAPGYWADVVAVEGNPLEDVSLLTDIRFVMKGGTVFAHGSAAR